MRDKPDRSRKKTMTHNPNSYRQSDTWKEILSEGTVWRRVLEELSRSAIVDAIMTQSHKRREWIFVGCGTSHYLAESAAYSWALLTGQPARALPGSEVLLFPKIVQVEGVEVQAVVISRSGRTSEAVRAASVLRRDLNVPTIGITCAESSELEKTCDTTMVLRAADEQSTVMTRSFTSMLIALQYLAARHMENAAFIADLQNMVEQLAPRIPLIGEQMEEFVKSHTFVDYVFLGQGAFHGIAREASLKVMEMSCSYSQFFHTLEFRHGPKAIVSPKTCLTFFLSDTGRDVETEVLAEMKDLGGVTIAICNRSTNKLRWASDLIVDYDFSGNELALLAAYVIPCQLFGFFTGLQRGLNPDHPKNLTRIVMLD
jgi:glutamine---fructose-6-phosphate transaminase (isomerizing)